MDTKPFSKIIRAFANAKRPNPILEQLAAPWVLEVGNPAEAAVQAHESEFYAALDAAQPVLVKAGAGNALRNIDAAMMALTVAALKAGFIAGVLAANPAMAERCGRPTRPGKAKVS